MILFNGLTDSPLYLNPQNPSYKTTKIG